MTQPAVIFSNYDGAHTADRAANNTCVAKVKRQTEWQKERSSRSLLPKSFVLGENLWRTTAADSDGDGDSKHCQQSKSKHGTDKKQAKKSGTSLFILIIFRFFFGIFRFTHCKVLQTRPDPVRASRLFTGKTAEDISRRNLAKYRKLNLNLAKQISPWPKTTRRKNPKLSAHMLLWMKPEKK